MANKSKPKSSKVTVTRHDGNEQCTQEIDASEVEAFTAAGWDVTAAAPEAEEPEAE